MAVLAKLFTDKITCTCYELGHTWTPSCKQASWDVLKVVFKQAVKIYGPLYVIAGLVQGKKKEYFTQSLPGLFSRSVVFLTTNGTLFITFFCVWRKIFGQFYCPRPAFFPALTAAYVAILVERKSRRGLLALYVANLAVETLFRMLVARGMVTPIPHGEVIIFSIASAIYMYLYRRNSLPKSMTSTFSKLVGKNELPSSVSNDGSEKRKESSGLPRRQNKSVQAVVGWIKNQPKHRLCQHGSSCIYYVLKGLAKNFGIGYCIQGVIKVVGSLPRLTKNPGAIIQALKHRDNFNLGAFLGCFSAIFRAVNCLLRWLRDKEDDLHGLVSGFLAGWSMLWFKSQTIALYAAFKLAEILYFKGISKGIVPYIKYADIIIYSISTAIIFDVAVVEPHNLRPAYWKFLLNVTGNRFAMMNRRLLLEYLPRAADIQPDFWPDYDPRFTDLKPPPNSTSVIKSIIR